MFHKSDTYLEFEVSNMPVALLVFHYLVVLSLSGDSGWPRCSTSGSCMPCFYNLGSPASIARADQLLWFVSQQKALQPLSSAARWFIF